jgi:hypothetical protein
VLWGMVLISSRKSVPPCASSKSPRRFSMAPVKEPFTWPKSSDSRRVSGSAEQFSATNGRRARSERSWIARATSSLPVPVSPTMSTVARVGATRSTMSNMRRMAGVRPTMASSPPAEVWRLRCATSRRSCSSSRALSSVSSSSSVRNGFLR